MFVKVLGSIANLLDPLDIYSSNTSPLVRMFAIEYPKEYNSAKKSGFIVNDRFVREYLTNRLT